MIFCLNDDHNSHCVYVFTCIFRSFITMIMFHVQLREDLSVSFYVTTVFINALHSMVVVVWYIKCFCTSVCLSSMCFVFKRGYVSSKFLDHRVRSFWFFESQCPCKIPSGGVKYSVRRILRFSTKIAVYLETVRQMQLIYDYHARFGCSVSCMHGP